MITLNSIYIYFLAIKKIFTRSLKEFFFSSNYYNKLLDTEIPYRFLFNPNPYLLSPLLNHKEALIKISNEDVRNFRISIFKNKEKKNKIYNIGSSKKIQIDKLVKKLSKEYNLKFNFKKKINLKKRPDIYIVNNKKLKKKFKNFKYIEGYPAIIKTIRILKKEKSIH